MNIKQYFFVLHLVFVSSYLCAMEGSAQEGLNRMKLCGQEAQAIGVAVEKGAITPEQALTALAEKQQALAQLSSAALKQIDCENKQALEALHARWQERRKADDEAFKQLLAGFNSKTPEQMMGDLNNYCAFLARP